MKAMEIEPVGMNVRGIEPTEMKARGTEAMGMEVEEIEVMAKDTMPTTTAQTQISGLSTIGDISETWPTMRDIKMNTLAMREKHRCQVWGVNLSLRSGTTSMLGECNHLLGWPSPR